jgi:hypothetical protein
MALATNTRYQLAKRTKADVELREPTYTVTQLETAAGDPLLIINDGSDDIAGILIEQRNFDGFNVVAELSASAAEGLPEHVMWLAVDSGSSTTIVARLTAAAKAIGTSSLKMVLNQAAPIVEADFIDANVATEIVNDARNGASGQ